MLLDGFDYGLHPDLWAYAKMYSYSIQNEPFIHIDNDVILWDVVPQDVLSKDLFFQNKEHLSDHLGYAPLINLSKEYMPKKLLQNAPMFAYNCGVVGANNLDIIREWFNDVTEYLFCAKNANFWQYIQDKHSQNHLFEQYFISALIHRKGLHNKTGTLLKDDFYVSAVRDFKMTHLWGMAKRDEATMQRVQKRLYDEYPEVKDNFEPKLKSHSEIFGRIYRNELWGKGQGSGGGSTVEITEMYRSFLQSMIGDDLNGMLYPIHTVADFGCGDWQFSKLIDWSKVLYTGYDCVSSVLDDNKQYESDNVEFVFAESIDEVSKADLLIVKDVLIHWTNEEVQKFLTYIIKSEKFRYALITNQTEEGNVNADISTGQFRNIDILDEPFDTNGAHVEAIWKWDNDNKTTYLLKF